MLGWVVLSSTCIYTLYTIYRYRKLDGGDNVAIGRPKGTDHPAVQQ